MKLTSWGFLALVGSLAFLVLYLKDREIRAGVDRLQHFRLPHSALPPTVHALIHVPDVQERERVVSWNTPAR